MFIFKKFNKKNFSEKMKNIKQVCNNAFLLIEKSYLHPVFYLLITGRG